uniref:Tudor domain-containing protein n=1 Tax=Romanomermis culicivorax TaxID=13658 RepID=A0A915IPJ7_ROMCU
MAYRFKDMNEKLMETYDNNAFRCPLLSVAKGRLCVAKRSNIFQYCRAIVIENINDFFVNVYFIDMALSEIVSVANLYLMTEEFALFPPMLFECSLSNVRPSEYLNEKFLEYIANAHDICIRIDSLADSVFDVTIFDVIFPNQNNLNDYLNNLASMHEQSYLPRSYQR